MGFRLNRPVRGSTLGRREFWFLRGGGLRRRQCRASLFLADQGHQIRLKTCAVLSGVAQQNLDQTAFARAKMSLNSPASKTVQERDRLLSQELFKFFGSHLYAVIREALFVKRPSDDGLFVILAVNVQR
jgi:hypothetical protein